MNFDTHLVKYSRLLIGFQNCWYAEKIGLYDPLLLMQLISRLVLLGTCFKISVWFATNFIDW
jgi:hypothetical protein